MNLQHIVFRRTGWRKSLGCLSLFISLALIALVHPDHRIYATDPTFFQPSGSPFSVGSRPISLAVGDFNGDGKLDLATANFSSNNISILLGNGTGGFTPASASPINTDGPYIIVAGDFNNDGKLDLAVTNDVADTFTIFLGDGTGGFTSAPGSPIGFGINPGWLGAGDFNNDGKLDLAVLSIGDAKLGIFIGDGTGNFTAAPGSPIIVGQDPDGGVIGDFNRDGNLDIATANGLDGTVSVLLGNGTGSFTAAPGSPIRVEDGPTSVELGDFNNDGKLDLITSSVVTNSVSVLFGNGNGGFNLNNHSITPVAGGPNSLVVADFNNDGKLDIATGNYNSNNVSVLQGNGVGVFHSIADSPFPVDSQPIFIAAGDFNGDDKIDLAVANLASDDVSILLNNSEQESTPPTPTPTFVPPAPSATPTATASPTATPTTISDPCANPVIITGGGTFSISTASTCFKYINTGFVNGGMFSIIKDATSTSDTLKWYGGFDQNVTSCANQSSTISGNGGQLNNFPVAKDANGQMFLTITGTGANIVSIAIQNWQNGSGCSIPPTVSP